MRSNNENMWVIDARRIVFLKEGDPNVNAPMGTDNYVRDRIVIGSLHTY